MSAGATKSHGAALSRTDLHAPPSVEVASRSHPAFTLTRQERQAIAHGDHTALKREGKKPDVKGGEEIELARSRESKQFVGRTREAREKNRGATIEVPSVPTLWITLKAPTLKHGRWVIEFTVHDQRRTQRRLAAVPNPRTDAGLRTRSGETVDREGKAHPRKVSPKGTGIPKFTDEVARGYGGGGLSAVDDLEAVDDATLADFSQRVQEPNRLRQRGNHTEAEKLSHEAQVTELRRQGNESGARAAERRAKRAERRLAAVA